MELAILLFFGGIGGVARGLVGFSKYYTSYKNVVFSWKYFLLTVGLSAALGAGVVWVIRDSGLSFQGLTLNGAAAFILGYAGGDVLENLYKILGKKPLLGPLESIIKAS